MIELKIVKQEESGSRRDPDPRVYKGNFYAIPHSKREQFLKIVKSYENIQYVIGEEIGNNNIEHFQGLYYMTLKQYNAFNARVKKTFKLVGKASNTQARQYGTIKKLKNKDTYASYCCKEQRKIHSNLPEHELKKYIEASYVKTANLMDIKVRCKEYIEKQIGPCRFNRTKQELPSYNEQQEMFHYAHMICQYFHDNNAKAPPSRSYIIYVLWSLGIMSHSHYIQNIVRL